MDNRLDAGGAVGQVYFCHRYAILFYTLLFTLVASPLVAALEWSGTLIDLFLGANLLAAALPSRPGLNRRLFLAAVGIAWLARSAMAWFDHPAVAALILGFWTLIGLGAAAAALHFAMRARQVELEHLYAALSAYLLVGVFFGLFYWIIEQVAPGTFNLSDGLSRMSAIYFSFVTLATLGYGDIVPRSDIARGLAILEGVGGQLFLAVFVARLLSLYSMRPKTD
ncbi:MAG TPA: ion channel [Candidatus Binatia bacterium]|nr:ion channel [Candidatus Binatia bacterium]